MIEYGPTVLKDYEHLAIIFGTGYKDENVLELSARVLNDYGDKAILKIKNIEEISEITGLPTVKACQLLALITLGQRFFSADYSDFPTIRSPEDAYKIFQPLENLKKETLEAIYLNARNRVIHKEIISIGTCNQTLIEPGEVYAPAIGCRAVAVIIAHNHPSGDCEPSVQDRENTKLLQKAGEILKKPLLDHLIIGKNKFKSLCLE